jgi:C4-dicarboxylate-binding protein DctP
MDEATTYANEISQKENDEALDDMKKSGKTQFIELNPDQKARWKKAMMPVYSEMGSRVGKNLIDEFEKVIKATGTN